MNLGNLRTMSRKVVPTAKENRVNDTHLDLIINEVCKDANARLWLLPNDEKFNVVADQYKYDLTDSSATVTRFAKISESGLWWNAGSASSPDWRRIYPKTIKWLDKNFEGWRDQDSSDPLYYAKRGKNFLSYPTPDTALTDGWWLYFLEETRTMSEDDHYPFGYETEISEYSFLTRTILKGVEAWLELPVGKDQPSTQSFQEYLGMIERDRIVINTNKDIQSDKQAKITLPRVC